MTIWLKFIIVIYISPLYIITAINASWIVYWYYDYVSEEGWTIKINIAKWFLFDYFFCLFLVMAAVSSDPSPTYSLPCLLWPMTHLQPWWNNVTTSLSTCLPMRLHTRWLVRVDHLNNPLWLWRLGCALTGITSFLCDPGVDWGPQDFADAV